MPKRNEIKAAIACSLCVLAGPVAVQAEETAPKWSPYIDLEGKTGNKRSLGEADLFLPLTQNDDTLLFASLRTRMDNHSSREGNFGLGLRRMYPNGWNLGGYGYYDRRRSPYGHFFNQATLGVEALSTDWDVRLNGYIPFGERKANVDSLNSVSFSGTTVTFHGGEERALGGFDAEVGWRAPLFEEDANQQMRLYMGGYRFSGGNAPTVQGPRARMDFTFEEIPQLWTGSRLSMGAEIQHDKPRGTQGFASLRLRIPFDLFSGGNGRKSRHKLTAQERRMTAPIVRDIDVVTQAGDFGTAETATTLDGKKITVVDSSTSSDLATAIAAAGADATVMLSGSLSTTSEVTVQSGQTIMGGGSLTVKSPSGRTATLSLPGATVTGTFSTPTGDAIFQMANNSTLKDLNLSMTNTNGVAQAIDVSNVSNVTISNNTISGSSTHIGYIGRAIVVNTVSNLTISNNTITANADQHDASGIYFTGTSTNNTIDNNTITVTAGANYANGILLGSNVQTVVSNNTFTSSGGTLANSTLYLNNATILAGSTGNVRTSGEACRTTGTNTGSVSFTDSSTCP